MEIIVKLKMRKDNNDVDDNDDKDLKSTSQSPPGWEWKKWPVVRQQGKFHRKQNLFKLKIGFREQREYTLSL